MSWNRNMMQWTAMAVTVLFAASCGGGDDAGDGSSGGGAAAAPIAHPVDAATAGSIQGMVTFSGVPATGEVIDLAGEDECAAGHTTPPMMGMAMVGPDGGLGEVFVYVKSGLADMEYPAEPAEVLDQIGCVYTPHVLAVSAGQDLTIRNSDDVLHNVNATAEENRGFNRGQPRSGMEFTTTFDLPEVMIPVRCDVHGWMSAYVGVTDHPYHAVTDESGSFTIERLPAGEYELEAWSELYGTATQMVTVPASGEVSVTFDFTTEMAGSYAPVAPVLYVDHASGTLRRITEDDPS